MIKRIVLLIILATLFGCSNGSAATVAFGTLHLGGLGGKPTIINPILTDRSISQALVQLIFNSLVRLNKEMLPEPDLAESWDISDDGLTYTFHLRKGVKFHDGVELTSEDVKFTYESAANPRIGCNWRDYFEDVMKYEAPDKYTFRITLKEPCASLLSRLREYIAPKHLLEGKDIHTAEFNYHPVGTGSFRFREWTNDDKIILTANPDYYEGRPAIDKIIATGYDSPEKQWGPFMRGEIDIAFFLSKEDFEIARRDPDFVTYTFPSPYTYGLEYNPEHPFFIDKKIRQAIGYAINTREIINKMENGYGMPSTGPFMPGVWSYNPEIKPIEYNPQKALALLKDAGWSLNKKGILEKDGNEFRILMLVNNKAREGAMLARMIYIDLYKIGIRMDIKDFDPNKAGEPEYKKLVEEAGIYVNAFIIMTDPTEIARDWDSRQKVRATKLWQYQNPEIDKLFDMGQVTSNINERKRIYHRIHSIIFEEQPVSFLYFFYHLGAVNGSFQNTDGLFTPLMPFWKIKDWKIRMSKGGERFPDVGK
jgi:peptide/nickel transport system substrate-binding protein